VEIVGKAFEMGKSSAAGSFRLFIGVATSTIVMAGASVIVGRLMTPAEYGLYGIVLVPATLINLFRDWGVNSAMTRYIAGLRGSNRDEEIHDFIVAGLIFEVASGILLSFLCLFSAVFIASTIFRRPESASYIAIVSASIISGSLLAASQAGFIGFERMGLNSFTLICQAIVYAVAGPALVLLGYSIRGAVVGYVLGVAAAGIIGVATFYALLLRPLRRKRTKNSSIAKALKAMLNYGVPLSIGSILTGILAQIYIFIAVPITSNATYGSYVASANFTVLLTFFSTPIQTVLFPTFAKLDPQHEHELIRTIFASSIKYASILIVPAAMILMVLSGPLVGTLYGQKYAYAPFFLTLAAINALYVVLGGNSVSGFLSGFGETRTVMKWNIITVIVGIPLSILLIPTFGITGLIIASLIDGLPSFLWVLRWTWKHYGVRADLQSSAKILAASTIAAFAAYLPAKFLNTTDWIKLIIGLIVFLIVYIEGAPLIGAVNLDDINGLRTMFSEMGIVTKIINLPLNAAEKAALTRSMNKKAIETS
jgi:O-antigen/teichoic acid export membrane protein